MTAGENVRFGLEFAGRRRSHPHDAFDDARSILGFVGLGEAAAVPAGALTPARQRLLEIGMALGARPQVLLLDEVAAGLTEAEVDATAQLIRRVRDELARAELELDGVDRHQPAESNAHTLRLEERLSHLRLRVRPAPAAHRFP